MESIMAEKGAESWLITFCFTNKRERVGGRRRRREEGRRGETGTSGARLEILKALPESYMSSSKAPSP